MARPDPALFHLNDNSNTTNGIYGGREERRPDDHPENLEMKNKAIGILETQGLTAAHVIARPHDDLIKILPKL